MVGTKQIFIPALRHILDHLQLDFQQALAAGAQVDVVGDTVELQIERVQAGFLAFCANSRSANLMPLVAAWMWEKPISLRHAQDLEELRVDGRLAAGELHDASATGRSSRSVCSMRTHLFQAGLVEVAGHVGIGETHRAGQVAAVGQVDVGEAGVAGVHASTARNRPGSLWRRAPPGSATPRLSPKVHFSILRYRRASE